MLGWLLEILFEKLRRRIPRLMRIEDFDLQIERALIVVLPQPANGVLRGLFGD